jgi:hypothetical protein
MPIKPNMGYGAYINAIEDEFSSTPHGYAAKCGIAMLPHCC